MCCTEAAEKGNLGLVNVVPWADESSGSCQEAVASISSVHPIHLQLSSPAALLFSFCFFPVFQLELVFPKVKQEMSWKMLEHFCIPISVQQRLCLFSLPASAALPRNGLRFCDSPVPRLVEDWDFPVKIRSCISQAVCQPTAS